MSRDPLGHIRDTQKVEVVYDVARSSISLVLHTDIPCTRSNPGRCTELKAALIDAETTIKEKDSLSRYRAFAVSVAALLGTDASLYIDDLSGYQLDVLRHKLSMALAPQSGHTTGGTAMKEDGNNEATIQKTVIRNAFDTAKSALSDGIRRGTVTMLVVGVRKPVVRLIERSLGKQAATRARKWFETPGGDAVFSVAVGSIGLGAQALGITGRFTDKINSLCHEAIAQGIQGGAKAVMAGALGDIFAAYTEAVSTIDAPASSPEQ